MFWFYLFDFYVAKNVQLVLVQGLQLVLQVDTIGKHGLQKDRHMRTCIPRTLSSAWRTRRILTALQLKESQPERGQFGYGRAQCRGLMTLMKSKMVRKFTKQKYCSAYMMLLKCCQKYVPLGVYSCCSQHSRFCLLPSAVQSTCM